MLNTRSSGTDRRERREPPTPSLPSRTAATMNATASAADQAATTMAEALRVPALLGVAKKVK